MQRILLVKHSANQVRIIIKPLRPLWLAKRFANATNSVSETFGESSPYNKKKHLEHHWLAKRFANLTNPYAEIFLNPTYCD